MECPHCNHSFKNKESLAVHQTNATYCLKLRDDIKFELKFNCASCKKFFSRKSNLTRHQMKCINYKLDHQKDEHKKELKLNSERYEHKISLLESEIRRLNDVMDYMEKHLTQQQRIAYLERKYLKKQSRVEYKERNVIYLLTTPNLINDRIYVAGKATNLTSRLSTYNKSEEHTVIYYQQCPSKEFMSVIETMVFSKLNEYRERANRERFILPEDKDISFFIDAIKECIAFFTK